MQRLSARFHDPHGHNDGACQAMQRFADQSGRNIGTLRFEDFSDEIHAYFTRNGRTRIFMRIQYEGETI